MIDLEVSQVPVEPSMVGPAGVGPPGVGPAGVGGVRVVDDAAVAAWYIRGCSRR